MELVTAALFGLVAWRVGPHVVLLAFLVAFGGLIALTAVDLERFVLPNRILYPTLFLCAPLLAVAAAIDGEWSRLARAVAGGSVAWLVLFLIHVASPRGMGFGDVRLAGLIGLILGWLGLGYVFVGLFLAFLSGALVGVALIALKLRSRRDRLPFGPFLSLGCLLSVLFGRALLGWYSVR